MAYVGYGIHGAVMAVQKLRAQAGVLRMAYVGPQVPLTPREDFVNFADFRPRELHVAAVHGRVVSGWSPLRTASRTVSQQTS